MIPNPPARPASRHGRAPRSLSTPALLLLGLLAGAGRGADAAPDSTRAPIAAPADSVTPPAHHAGDPWRADQIITPNALVRALSAPAKTRPVLLHVGYAVLYRGGHIPGSRYVGPGSKPEGVRAMKAAMADIPRDRPVVLYCGCCPWNDCPNVRAAFRAARELGFEKLRLLYLPKSLKQDWIDHGFGVESGE
ncbi:MAG TPA: rhodanese-like domain-containing protein [Candidatus Eisenbacteria bacterium]